MNRRGPRQAERQGVRAKIAGLVDRPACNLGNSGEFKLRGSKETALGFVPSRGWSVHDARIGAVVGVYVPTELSEVKAFCPNEV